MGHGGEPSLGRHLQRHHGRLPGSGSRNLPPPAWKHHARPRRPSSIPQLETPPHHQTSPHRWTPEDDATAAITIQQNPENPEEYHITWNNPAPHPPASPTLPDVFATISAELQEAKAPQQTDNEIPQAPSPPTTQESPRTEPLTHPITTMELPPQHRTTPDRNGFRNLPREWEVHNSTLRLDEITPGLQDIRLHSITEPTTTWTLPTDSHHLLLTIQGDATITLTEGDPITAAQTHAVHIPPQA